MRINWYEPRFDEEDIRAISEVIMSGFINEGQKTKELEEVFKRYLGVKHAIFTTSATAGLFLAIKADSIIRKKENFEVIIPDLTMIATATAVEWAGGKPILVDIERDRGNIDCSLIEEAINMNTTAIIPVHILGRGADIDKLTEIAERNNLTIIEDAAGALGSKNGNKFLGTFGKVGCYSLQSNKIISCGQGGIIVTDDDEYYEVMKRLKDFGRFNKEFLHEKIGYNLKMTDLSASIVISQFEKLESRKELLLRQRKIYEEELGNLKQIHLFKYMAGEIPLWIDAFVKERKELVEFLKENDINTRECWPSIHMNPPYKRTDEEFPISSYFSKNILWLPNGPTISDEQIRIVCSKIKEYYSRKEMKKIHEDKRGGIYLVKNMLEDNKEFTFLEIKKGSARGGCLHSNNEYFVVVKGKIEYVCGNSSEVVSEGESRMIPAQKAHAFIGLEDSIVSEWGITSEEKNFDKKDTNLRRIVDDINNKGY